MITGTEKYNEIEMNCKDWILTQYIWGLKENLYGDTTEWELETNYQKII